MRIFLEHNEWMMRLQLCMKQFLTQYYYHRKMSDKYFTKDFLKFVDACGDLNYHEVFELVQAAQGNTEVHSLFTREK